MDSGPGTAENAGALRRLGFAEPVVQALVAELQQELARRYGGPDDTPLDPTMFAPPVGAFFVAFDGGQPVAMGGWRLRPDVAAMAEFVERFPSRPVVAEIKRMYVVPGARGRGHARAVLARLEESARDAGARLMVLESGARQPEALTLYASAGYTPVPGYGFYRWSPIVRYLGKELTANPDPARVRVTGPAAGYGCAMTTNPAERGPHDPEHTPVTPEPGVVETDMPGVDPDWPQTPIEETMLGEDSGAVGNESVEG